MKTLISISMLSFCLIVGARAQNNAQPFGYYIDALRFSQTTLGGSARMQALGGVQISLGGDISSALSNPAGLGFYNRSEFSFTPAVNHNSVGASYFGESNSDFRTRFNFNQLGLALRIEPDYESIYKGGAFGISITRTNDFNSNVFLNGVNPNTSIIDSFLEQADGAPESQFGGNDLTSLAYYNYLIGPESILNPPGPDDIYFTDVGSIATQSESIRTSGAQYQWSLSYGGNVSDIFYFGLGLGIVDLRFGSERVYTESFDQDVLNDLLIQERLQIGGTGINGTFGVIVRPSPHVTVGASFITPTAYGIEDTYDASLSTDWDNFLYGDAINGDTLLTDLFAQTDILTSNYTLTTPWKLNGGATFFVGKSGFISADVSYSDNSRAKLRTNLFSMAEDNKAIQQFGSSVLDYKIGGEYRYNVLRVRAGYSNRSTSEDGFNLLKSGNNGFSGGVGIRLQEFFVDLGVVHTSGNTNYSPYFYSTGNPVANLDTSNTNYLISFGFNY